ncbi:MAG: ferritin-like domain-containing protein [Deltaproteobacteria bacterium]|nr:ferritin-like domain-containing protein [Deltaproteobacteria bacterium]
MALNEESRKKIIEALNLDRTFELAAIIQYLGHHYEAAGPESFPVVDVFKSTSIDEMRHAEKLAERIVYLGGVPVQKPAAVKRGGAVKAMVGDDLEAENEAIERYRKHIKLCDELGDTTTRLMLEGILSQEEGHADNWETYLGIKK